MADMQEVDKAVAGLIGALEEFPIGNVAQVTISPQASGQHPYRIITRDGEYPFPGLAESEPLPDFMPAASGAEPNFGEE